MPSFKPAADAKIWVQCSRLHLKAVEVNTGLSSCLVSDPPTWLSTIQQDLKHHHLTLPEAADLAQNHPLWRMMSTYGATQSWVACQKRRRRRNYSCDYCVMQHTCSSQHLQKCTEMTVASDLAQLGCLQVSKNQRVWRVCNDVPVVALNSHFVDLISVERLQHNFQARRQVLHNHLQHT